MTDRAFILIGAAWRNFRDGWREDVILAGEENLQHAKAFAIFVSGVVAALIAVFALSWFVAALVSGAAQ